MVLLQDNINFNDTVSFYSVLYKLNLLDSNDVYTHLYIEANSLQFRIISLYVGKV